ncbi:hypothetical protein FACS1894168_3360 [Deltaproteobacteria bacterium]|nr:hypothetical protein FACS1894168_3360 [Deltaproteobacteria bacterium]
MSQVFAFESRQVRTVTVNAQIWFVAKDVCIALGMPFNGHSLRNIPQEWKGWTNSSTPRGTQKIVTISEPAVYKLAFRSNKPEADAFTNWVASEVLPAIRKTGKFEAKPKQKALRPATPALAQGPDSYFLPGIIPELERDIKDIENKLEHLCVRMQLFAHPGGMLVSEFERNKPLIDVANSTVAAAKNACGTGYFMLQSVRRICAAMR